MARFIDLSCEIRLLIHTYVFTLGKIYPYQNYIPIDKNGIRYEVVSHGWLTALAWLGPSYRHEAEQILWSQNLVVFNGYTIRRFFSAINELKGYSYEAEILTWLRKSWIKRASVQFSDADEHYRYAITDMNPVRRAECDGIDFERSLEQKRKTARNDCFQWAGDLITQWILQARYLEDLQLDYLEVDVEQARDSSRNIIDLAFIRLCGSIVWRYGNARQVVCFRPKNHEETTVFYESILRIDPRSNGFIDWLQDNRLQR